MKDLLKTIDILDKFNQITAYYTPKQIAVINNMAVKIAKFKGPFTWHQHDDSDELFWVVKGRLEIEIKDRPTLVADENQLLVIPKGLEHRPNPKEETLVALIEPCELLNTGNVKNSFTVEEIEKI